MTDQRAAYRASARVDEHDPTVAIRDRESRAVRAPRVGPDRALNRPMPSAPSSAAAQVDERVPVVEVAADQQRLAVRRQGEASEPGKGPEDVAQRGFRRPRTPHAQGVRPEGDESAVGSEHRSGGSRADAGERPTVLLAGAEIPTHDRSGVVASRKRRTVGAEGEPGGDRTGPCEESGQLTRGDIEQAHTVVTADGQKAPVRAERKRDAASDRKARSLRPTGSGIPQGEIAERGRGGKRLAVRAPRRCDQRN